MHQELCCTALSLGHLFLWQSMHQELGCTPCLLELFRGAFPQRCSVANSVAVDFFWENGGREQEKKCHANYDVYSVIYVYYNSSSPHLCRTYYQCDFTYTVSSSHSCFEMSLDPSKTSATVSRNLVKIVKQYSTYTVSSSYSRFEMSLESSKSREVVFEESSKDSKVVFDVYSILLVLVFWGELGVRDTTLYVQLWSEFTTQLHV